MDIWDREIPVLLEFSNDGFMEKASLAAF